MRRIVILLALAGIVVGGVVYAYRSHPRDRADAARVHRYFVMGRRDCRRAVSGLEPTDVGNIARWTGIENVTLIPSPHLAARYRRALQAGCDAALG